MDMKVGDLTKSFWKASERPSSVSKTPSESYETATDAQTLVAELARRLNVLEQRIDIKVDKDGIPSAIMLAQDAMLITSDRIGVLGDVSFLDYVRDQNGTATGEIDYSVTRIRGGVIQTETIISGNLSETEGTSFNLDDGHFIIGGTRDPRFEYNNATATLDVRGNIKVSNTFESNGTTISEYGMFLTGTADYIEGLGPVGTGIVVGSPGIYGLYGGVVKFAFDVFTGDAFFGGSVETDGYIKVEGNEATGFSTDWGFGPYDVEGSIYGYNTVNNDNAGKITAGVVGRVSGRPNDSGFSAGLFGHVDGGTDTEFKAAVMGFGYQLGYGGYFTSDSGIALRCATSGAGSGAIAVSATGWGMEAKGSGGIVATANNQSTNFAVLAEGILATNQKLEKTDKSIGTLEIFSDTGVYQSSHQYRFI